MIGNPMIASHDVAANFGNNVDSSNVRNFTLGTAAELNAVPDEWQGRFVRLKPNGSTLYYIFTSASGMTPTLPAAATAAGAGAVGQCEGPYADGSVVTVRVPKAASGSSIYFGRIGGTNTQSVQMILADGTYGLIGP